MMFDIQKEIDICSANGGGTVIVPPGEYHCGTVYLKDKVTLHLSDGAVICGSTELNDYPPPPDVFTDGADQARGRALIMGFRVSDVAIEGKGIIFGNGEVFAESDPQFNLRPMLVRFVESSRVRIEGVKLRAPAAWTLHMRDCEDVDIFNIDIYSQVNCNNDGIDVDSCRRVTVKDCTIDSGDDGIVLKSTAVSACEDVHVSGCTVRSRSGAFKIGTETYGDIRRVKFENNTILRGDMGAIKIYSADGAVVEDIHIANVNISGACNPFFAKLGSRGRVYGDMPVKEPGRLRNIKVENVRAKIDLHHLHIYCGNYDGVMPYYAHNCLAIMGLPEVPITDISFSNVQIEFPGSMGKAVSDKPVPEFPDRYPEIAFYGIIPASSVYLRHVERIKFSGCDFTLNAPDTRKKVVLVDSKMVEGV